MPSQYLHGRVLDFYLRCRLTYTSVRNAMVRAYAAYHAKRQSPGRVYRIPGRGYSMWLPISWGKTVAQRRFGIYEPWTYGALDRIVSSGMAVIELGACYGEFTIYLSRLVGPTGRVYAFEPFPKYFSILTRNVALNRLVNVECINQAVGPHGIEAIYFDPKAIAPYDSLGQISRCRYPRQVAADGGGNSLTEAVPCVSLADFITSRQIAPDLLFLDIEGCEIDVLKDIEPALRSNGRKPIFYVELHTPFYRPGDLEWLQKTLKDSGYTVQEMGRHLLCTPAELCSDGVSAG